MAAKYQVKLEIIVRQAVMYCHASDAHAVAMTEKDRHLF
jgi:hypothetical protein